MSKDKATLSWFDEKATGDKNQIEKLMKFAGGDFDLAADFIHGRNKKMKSLMEIKGCSKKKLKSMERIANDVILASNFSIKRARHLKDLVEQMKEARKNGRSGT